MHVTESTFQKYIIYSSYIHYINELYQSYQSSSHQHNFTATKTHYWNCLVHTTLWRWVLRAVIGGLPILAIGVLLLVMNVLMLIVGALVLKMESLAAAVGLVVN